MNVDANGIPIQIDGTAALVQERRLSFGVLPAGTRCRVLEIYHAKGDPKAYLRKPVDAGLQDAVPSSMAGICPGVIISVGVGADQEYVTVLSVNGDSFRADFNKPHGPPSTASDPDRESWPKTKMLITNGLTLGIKWPAGPDGLNRTFPARMDEVEAKGV